MNKNNYVIQLAQIGQPRAQNQFLPYAAGLLQAFAMRHSRDASRYTFMPILVRRPPIHEQKPKLQIVDILACSCYVWNMQYSLELARAFKELNPDGLVIFGGPHVPDRAEEFLRQNPEVDVACHSEGESPFLEVLESLPTRQWEEIAGISYLQDGKFFHRPPRTRRKNLEEIPSPYLTGVFDPLLKQKDMNWNVLWETNRGCPFSCTFCDWGSATASKVNPYALDRLKREIDWMAQHQIEVVNCCDANFGIFPRDREIAEYAAEVHNKTGYPAYLWVQGAKNVTERIFDVQKIIIDAGMDSMVTLALQSVTPAVLKAIKRENISLETFRILQHRFQKEGIKTYTDMLVGLPGETYDSYVSSVSQVIQEGQNNLIQFFNVYILPNAELAQPDYREEHGIETVRIPYTESYFPENTPVQEWHELLIGTRTMPKADWRRIRIFTWWVELLYIHRKMMQLPLLLIHSHFQISFRDIFEHYAEADFSQQPILDSLQKFLENKTEAIQRGEHEHCLLEQGGQKLWLTLPEFIFTGLKDPEIAWEYYAQQYFALQGLLRKHGKAIAPGLLQEILGLSFKIFVNYAVQQDFEMTLQANFWEVYQGALQGESIALKPETAEYSFRWTGPPKMELEVDVRPVSGLPSALPG